MSVFSIVVYCSLIIENNCNFIFIIWLHVSNISGWINLSFVSGVCIVMRLLDLDFRSASTNDKRTTHLYHIIYIAAYGQENKVVNDYTYVLYTACCNVYYIWFVYLIIDVVVTFQTLICGISNAST